VEARQSVETIQIDTGNTEMTNNFRVKSYTNTLCETINFNSMVCLKHKLLQYIKSVQRIVDLLQKGERWSIILYHT